MENVIQNALTIVAVVICSLILITLVFRGVNSGKKVANNAQEELNYLSTAMADELSDLNGEIKSGAQVANYIKKWDSKGEQVVVTVVTPSGSRNYLYEPSGSSLSASSYRASDIPSSRTDSCYIEENRKFSATVSDPINAGVPTQITFRYQ